MRQHCLTLLWLLCATSAHAAGVLPTPTPPPLPSPRRTGDLGDASVKVFVYDAARGQDHPLRGAVVSYTDASAGDVGYCYTDAEGTCDMHVFLHDVDQVDVSVEAAGFRDDERSFTGLDLAHRSPPKFGLSPRGLRTLSGFVRAGFSCEGSLTGALITLEPSGRSTRSGVDGSFVFDDVLDGDYALRFSPDCQPTACYPRQRVSVKGSDVSIDLCPSPCPPDAIAVSPHEVAAGTSVQVTGRCYAIHSGQHGAIYFDDDSATQVIGDTIGNYSAAVQIPSSTSKGHHAVRFIAGSYSSEASVVVTEEPRGCLGDCDGDRAVTPDELRCAVDAALGLSVPDACVGFDSDGDGRATIQELVLGVARHLNTCDNAPGDATAP